VQKEYYQEYYRIEREHWWFIVRAEILMQKAEMLLRNVASPKILNIGAATGRSSQLLNAYGMVKSVEYDQDCYEFTKTLDDIDIIQASITELPFDDASFDLVCAFDVIEHVEDDEKAWQEMRRVCKPGGKIMVSVPAFLFLWSEHDIINHHQRRYTKKTLLKIAGTENNLYCSYFNTMLFFPIAIFRLLKNMISGRPRAEHAKSDFKGSRKGLLSLILQWIFRLEKPLIQFGISLPFGVSLMLIQEKR
jgi:SAM-dependent methyltransferase